MFKRVIMGVGALALTIAALTVATLSDETALASSETTHYDAGAVGTVSEDDTFLALVTAKQATDEQQVRWVEYSDGSYTVVGGACQFPTNQQWRERYSQNIGDTVTPTHRLTASAEEYLAPGWWAGYHLYNGDSRGLSVMGKNSGANGYIPITETEFDVSLRYADAADLTCVETDPSAPAPTPTPAPTATPDPPAPTPTPVPYIPDPDYTAPTLDTVSPGCTDDEAIWRAGVLEVTAPSSADYIETDYYAAYANNAQSGNVRIHDEGRVCVSRNASGAIILQSIAAEQDPDSGVDSSRFIDVEADRGFTVRNIFDSPGLHISGDTAPYVGKFYYADLIQEAENYRREVYRVTEVYADEWHSKAAILNANWTSASDSVKYGYGENGSDGDDADGDDMRNVDETTQGFHRLTSPIIQHYGDANVWHWYNSESGRFWLVEYMGLEPADVHNGRLPATPVAPNSIPAAPALKAAGDYTFTQVRVDGKNCTGVDIPTVKDSNKTPVGTPITVTITEDSRLSALMAAADELTTHSINPGIRFIDTDGEVYNCDWESDTYWQIAKTSASTTYTVEHVRVDGNRSSAQAVKDAAKTTTGIASGSHSVTLTGDHTTADILAAADQLSTHSITTGSRYIDADGEVHNFRSGKSTYWLITEDTEEDPVTPAVSTTYTKTHVEIDGCRCSEQAVISSNKTERITSIYQTATLTGESHTWAEIATALDVDSGSRTIDATDPDNARVINFRPGKNTYLLIEKQ